jgi:hypothetical protein
MAQTIGAIEETGRIAIHQNGKAHLKNTMRYPRALFLPKTTPPQQVRNLN